VYVEFSIQGKPPYKQAPADSSERENQKLYRHNLEIEARKHFPEMMKGDIKMEIFYTRAKGRSDAANNIGGIADTLQGIAFADDKQVVEIHYREKRGITDAYSIKISSLV